MFTVGICDDEKDFLFQMERMLDEIIGDTFEWEKIIYPNGEAVIADIEQQNFRCNLIFMDIAMGQKSGLDVANYINSHDTDVDMVFVTRSREHVYDCYQYKAFAYLLKPITLIDIEKTLERYMNEQSEKTLTLTNRGIVYKIPLKKILYIESHKRKITVHTTLEIIESYEKLYDLEKSLREDGFIRTHQSYLVNTGMVTAYGFGQLMIGNQEIPISRRFQEDVKNFFKEQEMVKKIDNHASRMYRSIARKQEEVGALVCIKGEYLGAIIRIKPEQKIIIGRDGEVADLVVNLPAVSRKHCMITYHSVKREYEITDFSTNGTFVGEGNRLVKEERYVLQAGAEIYFGDSSTLYKLG